MHKFFVNAKEWEQVVLDFGLHLKDNFHIVTRETINDIVMWDVERVESLVLLQCFKQDLHQSGSQIIKRKV